MSGYIDRSDPDIPLMTRERWIGLIVAIVAAGSLFVVALMAGKLAIPLLDTFDNRISRFGLIVFIIGSSFLLQPESAPDDLTIPRRTPRSRRAIAISFYALGVAMIAAGAIFSR